MGLAVLASFWILLLVLVLMHVSCSASCAVAFTVVTPVVLAALASLLGKENACYVLPEHACACFILPLAACLLAHGWSVVQHHVRFLASVDICFT